jgi:hypothetical protein
MKLDDRLAENLSRERAMGWRVGLAAVLGLLQGLGLYWIEDVRNDLWTAGSLALYAGLVFGPTVLQLSWDHAARLRFWILAAMLTAVLVGMGAYAGWSVAGTTRGMIDVGVLPFWLAAIVITLGALPAIQAGRGVGYADGSAARPGRRCSWCRRRCSPVPAGCSCSSAPSCSISSASGSSSV